MRIARVRAGGRVYARTGGVILKMGKWGATEGVRSRAPPVADTARRSTRSGRKERTSEQREVLFGYHKAGDRREPTERQAHGEGRRSRRRAQPGGPRPTGAGAHCGSSAQRLRRGRSAAESGGEKRIPPLGGGEKGRKLYLWSVGALVASTRFSALVTRLSREVANSG